jgi:hypothetical protein
MRYSPALACTFLAALAAADQVETIDAQTAAGQVVRIGPDGVVVRADAKDRTIGAGEVSQVSLGAVADLMAQPGRAVLVTVAGDQLIAEGLSVSDGKVIFKTPGLGDVRLDLSAVRVIYLPEARQTPSAVREKLSELKASEGEQDALLVARDKDFFTIGGVLKGVDAASVLFRWKDGDKKVDRTKVQAIRLASMKAAPAAAGFVQWRSGVQLAFHSLTLDEAAASAATVSLGPRTIPRNELGAVRFRCDRVVELSSLKPAAVREHGFFDHVFPHRVNRSVGGGPLRLGEKTYATGLGLHSFCELTYDLGGSYRRFVAVVGIDQAVRPNGDAQLTILADGKPVAGPMRLTGKDEPQTLRLTIEKAKTLVIRVEFGQDDLDVADHVDLALARLIK